MNIKILVATHKKYYFPKDECYMPIHVGRDGKLDIGYIGDNTGDNISCKNGNYCELTALYWAWKNLECDYIGLVHYRRYFTAKKPMKRIGKNKMQYVLSGDQISELLEQKDVILPKKRHYYVETLYSHYSNTHYAEHLDITREIIQEKYTEYLVTYDEVMKSRSGHMFNMFIMKKELLDQYCEWLFDILEELERKVDVSQYTAFQARLFGRVSELLLNVWIVKNEIKYNEASVMHMEKIDWNKKALSFCKAKIFSRKYEGSF